MTVPIDPANSARSGPSTGGDACYLGIDLGGTNIKAGVIDGSGRPLSSVKRRTEADKGPDHGIQNIFRAGEDAVAESGCRLEQIAAVGIATPGTMDIPGGMMLEPPNLPGWVNIPIRQIVADHFDKPAVLQNDANAAAFGEFRSGAGRDAHSMILWTLGTGLGCGIIIGDTIIEGAHSHGSECGHIIVQTDDARLCTSGHYGELEAYASATSLIERCQEGLDAGRETILRERMDAGADLTPILIGQAAEDGDRFADDLIMETARFLGVGTTSLMHTIDPDMILIGGAMTFGCNETSLGRRFLQRVRDEVRVRAFPVPFERTIIEYATLGGSAGYIGAAGCAWLKHRPSATAAAAE